MGVHTRRVVAGAFSAGFLCCCLLFALFWCALVTWPALRASAARRGKKLADSLAWQATGPL